MDTYQLAEPPPVKPPETPEVTPSPVKKYKMILLIIGVVFGFILMFILGIVVSSSGRREVVVAPTPTPAPEPVISQSLTPSPGSNTNAQIAYMPGKEYYDDTIMIVGKKEPHRALIIAVSRFEQQKNFAQQTKVQYYPGTTWLRENVTAIVPRPEIINNPLIRRWSINTTITNSFTNDNRAEVTISNTPVMFTLKKISYDITSKSYPGYNKFNYFGEGTLKTPDEEEEAYFIYTQTYAANAFDLSFLSTPGKLENDWIAFWDEQGTAYFVDNLSSDQGSKPYQNYKIGSVLYPDGKSLKFTQANVQKAPQGNQYTAGLPINTSTSLTFQIANPVDKATDKTYTWQSGVITGIVTRDNQTINGVGLMESIHRKR